MMLAIPVALIWWPGCRTYPPVTTRESLSLLRLLNTACNTRDSKLIARAQAQFVKLKATGRVDNKETKAFDTILDLAMSERWAEAEAEAFRMAQDQVGVGR